MVAVPSRAAAAASAARKRRRAGCVGAGAGRRGWWRREGGGGGGGGGGAERAPAAHAAAGVRAGVGGAGSGGWGRRRVKKRKEKLSLFCLRLTPASDTPSAPPVSLPPCPPTTAPLTPATSRATCPAPSRPGRSAATARAVRCCAYGDGQRGTRATFFSRSLSLSSSHLLPLSPPPNPQAPSSGPTPKRAARAASIPGAAPRRRSGSTCGGGWAGSRGEWREKKFAPMRLVPSVFYVCKIWR